MVVLRMGWPIHRRLQEENERLKQREDGDTFNPKTSTPREIALALYGQLTPYRGKAEKVWREFGRAREAEEGQGQNRPRPLSSDEASR